MWNLKEKIRENADFKETENNGCLGWGRGSRVMMVKGYF